MGTLSLEDAAATIGGRAQDGSPIPFSIEFVTCDIKRKIGGERIRLKYAGIYTSVKKMLSDKPQPAADVADPERTNANWRQATRNIQCLRTGKPYKVHLLLIEKINGITVAL